MASKSCDFGFKNLFDTKEECEKGEEERKIFVENGFSPSCVSACPKKKKKAEEE